MRQVETYQAVILITQLTSSGKFCKINEWSNLSLTAILGWVKNPPRKRSGSGNPLLPLSKCVRLSVLPEGLILAIRRHLFCRRRPHIKVGDCFLDLCSSHDVRGCMRWTDLVKCCLALISLNDLASAARMRSCGCGNPCRKSLLGPPRSLK